LGGQILLMVLVLVLVLNALVVLKAYLVYAEDKAKVVSSYPIYTSGSAETWNLVLSLSGIRGDISLKVTYSVQVKNPPSFARIYAAVMQYYDYGRGGGFIEGAAFGHALSSKSASCLFLGQLASYYVEAEWRVKENITTGKYWTWDGEWYLHVREGKCLWPDSDFYKGYPSIYATHVECWGSLCG